MSCAKQLGLHLLLSFHPTYRESTSFGIFPSSTKPWTEGALPPDSASPLGNGLASLDDLRGNKELANRRKANACFVVLGKSDYLSLLSSYYNKSSCICGKSPPSLYANPSAARNSDLWSFLDSMKQMEDRFNHWAQYDYVFLNEEVSSSSYCFVSG